MKKILFLIHDLGQGGAEKVLINLVNNMDHSKFDITVMALFGGGVNEPFLSQNVCYKTVFSRSIPGNSKWMKFFSPKQLHRFCIKEHYDIEVSYLEGPSARVISGCTSPDTKLVSWIHSTQHSAASAAASFRNIAEAKRCYESFHQTICVSQYIKKTFCESFAFQKSCCILYNTVDSRQILANAQEPVPLLSQESRIKLVSVGTLKEVKGFDRLLRCAKRLADLSYPFHLYILGSGPLHQKLENYINANALQDSVSLLGHHTNPYKFVANCDLFICSSHSEGFSTAATEALIVGTPVITTRVSGMEEMLGCHNEFGVIVDNSEEALYCGLKQLLDNPQLLNHYKTQANIRGKFFSTVETVRAVEKMLSEL